MMRVRTSDNAVDRFFADKKEGEDIPRGHGAGRIEFTENGRTVAMHLAPEQCDGLVSWMKSMFGEFKECLTHREMCLFLDHWAREKTGNGERPS